MIIIIVCNILYGSFDIVEVSSVKFLSRYILKHCMV